MLSIEEFEKIDLRIGTVIEAKVNKKSRNPAYKLKIDLGEELGVKTSSAQIASLYSTDELIGRQVIVVANFKPIHIEDVTSEVRILGADLDGSCVILAPEQKVPNGSKIY